MPLKGGDGGSLGATALTIQKHYTPIPIIVAQKNYIFILWAADWMNAPLNDAAAFPGFSALPLRLPSRWSRPNLVEIWLGLCPAICHRSTGGGGPPVPSLPKLSMAFGTYFIWMPGQYKWRTMDILWILWTIPAVIAVEGKLMFWSTGVAVASSRRLWRFFG